MDCENRHRLMQLFRFADKSMKRTIGKKVEDTGAYRSQHQLLMILGKHPDCSQTEIAEKMEISPAAVAVSLKKLEKSGYISRQCNENDNRVNHVEITEKGIMTISVSVQYFNEMDKAFFDGFSETEQKQFENFLERIIKNSENYYQDLLRQEDVKIRERKVD